MMRKVMKKVKKDYKRGVNSLIILGAWMIWKHRNACVFNGSAPSIPTALQAFKDESHLWVVGGAKGLHGVGLRSAT